PGGAPSFSVSWRSQGLPQNEYAARRTSWAGSGRAFRRWMRTKHVSLRDQVGLLPGARGPSRDGQRGVPLTEEDLCDDHAEIVRRSAEADNALFAVEQAGSLLHDPEATAPKASDRRRRRGWSARWRAGRDSGRVAPRTCCARPACPAGRWAIRGAAAARSRRTAPTWPVRRFPRRWRSSANA